MNDKTLECPHCEETFKESEAAWHVCLDCGEIFPPGESWSGHGPGITYGEERELADGSTYRPIEEWPCNTAVKRYSREAAERKAEAVRSE